MWRMTGKRRVCLWNAHAYLGLAAIAEVDSASGFMIGFSRIRPFEVADFYNHVLSVKAVSELSDLILARHNPVPLFMVCGNYNFCNLNGRYAYDFRAVEKL